MSVTQILAKHREKEKESVNTLAFTGMLKEKITPHLRRLIEKGNLAVKSQFSLSSVVGVEETFVNPDPLGEDSLYSPTKGIVHKFGNRALIKVSYRCAAHCQFCTRARQIGDPSGDLTDKEIEDCLSYIIEHSEIDDVILSGGDPFVTPAVTEKLVSSLAQIDSIKVIRVGTRLPFHAPNCFEHPPVLRLVEKLKQVSENKPVYILVHLNHPDELGPETKKVLTLLKRSCSNLLSQSVFLNGINDDPKVLGKLFTELYHIGVLPYYIYRCDSVSGLERFVCPIEKEKRIMTELRRTLSGIAIPTYVVDVPGRGKIPVPLDFWDGIDTSKCLDYDGLSVDL